MERCFMLMCRYSNSYAAIKISEGCSYHEVVEKISAKFEELSVGNFCLFFSIPGYSNCIVECDDDLGNMLSMVGCSGSHVVDVVVGDKRIVEVDDDNSCRIDSIIHSVGQEFEGGVLAFHIALAKYAVECGFAVNYLKNDATRVTAECMMKLSTGCKWFIHGRVLMNSGIFFIMKLDNVHTCGVVARRSCSKMVGSRLVSDIVHNDISDNPLTRPIELGVDKARGGLFGDFATSFDQLRWYLEMAMRTNPGSVFELDVDESSGCFRRLFVAFHGCLYGFQFCRPLLFVDGTFLKGRYKGYLLAATSKNGNQSLFPLAFVIVDAENQDNWM
ncbi:hypothetical protein ACSBR1_035008 [Camellia fascicularis]